MRFYFCMSWFSQSATATVEPEPGLFDEERLLEISVELAAAEQQFNDTCEALHVYAAGHPDPRKAFLNKNLYCRVNAMSADPVRQKLESSMIHALEKRNKLLKERATLMLALGIIR